MNWFPHQLEPESPRILSVFIHSVSRCSDPGINQVSCVAVLYQLAYQEACSLEDLRKILEDLRKPTTSAGLMDVSVLKAISKH